MAICHTVQTARKSKGSENGHSSNGSKGPPSSKSSSGYEGSKGSLISNGFKTSIGLPGLNGLHGSKSVNGSNGTSAHNVGQNGHLPTAGIGQSRFFSSVKYYIAIRDICSVH